MDNGPGWNGPAWGNEGLDKFSAPYTQGHTRIYISFPGGLHISAVKHATQLVMYEQEIKD